ncbi:hypothetical protein QUF64_14425 [Anaerolineales bacterium HSG6]|nr:hypothetical protein [Anaerolineales bacterium HSG6]MDM8531663.1 hypothetical protein [Anaerolineales bacterium HSG25]
MNNVRSMNRNQVLNTLLSVLVFGVPLLCGFINQARMLLNGKIMGIYVFVNPPEYIYPIATLDLSWWVVLVLGTGILMGVVYINNLRTVSRALYPLYLYLLFMVILIRPILPFSSFLFDSTKWLEANPNEMTIRHQMFGDLVQSNRLAGHTPEQVAQLLGAPDDGNLNGMAYGSGGTLFGRQNQTLYAYKMSVIIGKDNRLETNWLIVIFENGIVNEYFNDKTIQ